MKDQVLATSMNGCKGEEIPCDNNSYQLDHVVEQTNIDLTLPLPDMEKLERSRRAKAREAMEVRFSRLLVFLSIRWSLVLLQREYKYAANQC